MDAFQKKNENLKPKKGCELKIDLKFWSKRNCIISLNSRNLRTEEWKVSWLARGGAMYDIWIKGKEMSKDDDHKMIEFLYPSSKTMCIF